MFASTLLDRCVNTVCQCDVTRIFCLHTEDYTHNTSPEGVYCRTLERKDLEKIALLPQFKLNHQFLLDFSRYHFLGVGVFVNKKLVGMSFYASGEVVARHNSGGRAFQGMGVYLPPGAGFMFKVFVLPQYRGRRLFEAMVSFALSELGTNHTQHLITTTPWKNSGAVKSLLRQGFVAHTIAAEFVVLGKHFFKTPSPFDPNTGEPLKDDNVVGTAIRFRSPALC